MCDHTYSRYKNLIGFGRILGITNLRYGGGEFRVSGNPRRFALLAILAYLIYDSVPSADSSRHVHYTKRNVSHFIEHFMVALIIIGFTRHSIKASEQFSMLLKAQYNVDVGLVQRLKVRLTGSGFRTFYFVAVYALGFTAAAIYFYGKVRKSLAMKLVLATSLFFTVGFFVETFIWLVERMNLIGAVLKEADKGASYCGLCLQLESQFFDSLCFRHKLIITEHIYNEICDVISLINGVCPLHLFYLMGFFEITGELLYFVPLIFKSQPIDYNVYAINLVLLVIVFCGFLSAVFCIDWILLKVNRTANNIYKLRTTNVKIIEFTRRIVLNPLKFTFAGNCVNLNYALQIANSIVIFCSILITFNYIV